MEGLCSEIKVSMRVAEVGIKAFQKVHKFLSSSDKNLIPIQHFARKHVQGPANLDSMYKRPELDPAKRLRNTEGPGGKPWLAILTIPNQQKIQERRSELCTRCGIKGGMYMRANGLNIGKNPDPQELIDA